MPFYDIIFNMMSLTSLTGTTQVGKNSKPGPDLLSYLDHIIAWYNINTQDLLEYAFVTR